MAARLLDVALARFRRRQFFLSILMIGLLLSANAADACRMRPQPYSRQSAERIAADGKGFAFRGKVLERFYHCDDDPGSNPSRKICYYDLKIDVMESFGREIKGIVLLKHTGDFTNRHHTAWEMCGYLPRIDDDEYFHVAERDAKSLSLLDIRK